MLDPTAVKSPSDLPRDGPLVVEAGGQLRLAARQPFGYNFNWLHEIALGIIEGDLGLKVDATGEAAVSLAMTGSYRQEISLDERGWLRLQVFKRRTQDFDFASQLSVSAQAATPLPEKFEALAAAILGVHEGQWLKDLAKLAESPSDALGKLLPRIPLEPLRRLLKIWNGLEPAIARIVWASAGQSEVLQNITGSLLVEESLAETLKQLKEYSTSSLVAEDVAKGLESLAGFQALDAWVKSQIEGLFGPVESEAAIGGLLEGLRAVLGLRDSVYQKAVGALEKKYSAEVSYCYKSATEDTALLDCSFDFTEEGLGVYRQALGGDYSWIVHADPQHAAIRRGVLTSQLQSESRLELHLPFLDRKEWTTRLEALARMEVASDEDGRLLAYHVDASSRIASKNSYQSVLALAGGLSVGRIRSSSSFTLSYSDKRRVPCAQAPAALAPALRAYRFDNRAVEWLEGVRAGKEGDLDVSLALSIPGSLASAWLDAPGERDPFFFPAYARVSVAVQRSMRAWLPYVYFASLERYGTLDAAFPLVVYQASRPFAGQPKYDFNYDVMSDESMASFFRLAAQQLPKELARVEELLLAAGNRRTAAFYSPKQARNILTSVQQKPRLLHSLLVADAFLVNALVNLGCRGREVREQSTKDPEAAVKGLSRFAAGFVKAFHGKLRRLYGGQEFLALGSLLLVEATSALSGDSDGRADVQAVLRVSRGEKGQPDSIEQTLVNAAYLPPA
jgi:hypothetical protein